MMWIPSPNTPHPFRPHKDARRLANLCAVCNGAPGDRLHILPLPGMENTGREREEARQVAEAARLTARLLEARPSIDSKTGEMERESPLFFGVIHPTLLTEEHDESHGA